MDEIVVEELDRADRYNFPISVFMMDIDYFKRVNDTWGHPIGDIILKHTAEITLKNIRKSDFLIRFGGEEFLLFMPHIELNQAVLVAEKVRQEIEGYTHPVVGKYTASFGVAERKRGETFQSLYQRADAAMYRAKQEGRNRVVSDTNQDTVQSKVIQLSWRDEWNSGNEVIDHLHQELLDMINQVTNLSVLDVEEGIIKEKMDLIIEHTVNHFETEEKILQQAGYPYYKNHAGVHAGILKRAKELENAYLAGTIKLTTFSAFLLDEVIVGHVLDMDTKFFSYVKEHHDVT
jgi:diguanylate cyclase (GGDEF)-like protein/hemerythrin-like metal-binding protein